MGKTFDTVFMSPGKITTFQVHKHVSVASVYVLQILLDDSLFPALFVTFYYPMVLSSLALFPICMLLNYNFSLKNSTHKITSRVTIS